jgi:hypothetical protein
MAMIEKQCGPTPPWMATNSQSKTLRGIYLQDKTTRVDGGTGVQHEMRIDWPAVKRREGSLLSWQKMKTLDQLVQHEFNHHHRAFLDLVQFMMKVDPDARPNARQCLEHSFFAQEIPDDFA